MKEIRIDSAIRRDGELLKDVERATQLLEQEIGPSASDVTADWSLVDCLGEEMVKIEISDRTDNSSTTYSRSGLALMAHHGFRSSLIRLWGDLLQARSHKQVEKLKFMVQSLKEE